VDMFLQQVLNGLTLGGIYSLVALGLTLVYGILAVPNFAHGAFYMVGAFVSFYLMSRLGWNYWLAMIGSGLAVAVLAILAERLVFHPLRKSSELHPMIAAIGLLLFLEAGAQAIWGADFHRMATPYAGIIDLGGVTAPLQRLLIIGAAFTLVALLQLFLKYTVIGSSIIAMAQDREGASLINLVYPAMGQLVILKAFVIIILGGMGSVPGAIVGGLIIGMAESFGAFYISTDYKDIIAFVLLVVILSVRPQGLFTRELRAS
jgi:branched-chain amino acid transport system permease protein